DASRCKRPELSRAAGTLAESGAGRSMNPATPRAVRPPDGSASPATPPSKRSGLDWRLPAWANSLMQVLTLALNFTGGVALGFGCTAVMPDPLWAPAAFVCVFALIELSVVIHECGHALLGRLAGMTVVVMQVGWVQLLAQ